MRWQLPPLLWTGSLAFDIRRDQLDTEGVRQQRLVTATLGTATYLYAPWLAIVNGTVGLTRGTVQGDAPDDSSGGSRFVTGKLQLSLLPRSRFPSELRYEVSDSRIDSSLGGGVDYRSRNVSVLQRYRPVNGEFSVSASYERRSQDSADFGQDTQDSFLADFASHWKRHQLTASLTRSANRRGSTGEESDFTSLVARHSAAWAPALSLESSVNWARSDDQLRFDGSGLTGRRSTTLAQASSLAVWRGDTVPLTVTGSLRAFTFDGGGENNGTTLAAGLGATYEFSRQARVNASLTATSIDGNTSITSVGQVSGTYQGDQRQWGTAQWSWFSSAAVGAARTDARTDASVSTQLGHNLSNVWLIGGSSWGVSLAQTGSVAVANQTASPEQLLPPDRLSRALTQTLAFTWTKPGEQGSAFSRLSFTDARQFDSEKSHFSFVNFQVSGTHELDRRRSWTGDLTWQRSVQSSTPLPTVTVPDVSRFTQNQRNASGELTWRHLRVFDVPRLNFTSRLRVALNTQRQSDEILALPDRETASWENRLDHQVGRLENSFSMRVSKVDGRRNVFLMWRLQRNFGG